MSKDSGVDELAIENLWYSFRKRRTIAKRDRLYAHYERLPRLHAARFKSSCPPSVTFDELLSFAVEGLLRAIDKYDPAHESDTAFVTFAYRRIDGAIRDGLRSDRFGGRSRHRSETIISTDFLDTNGRLPFSSLVDQTSPTDSVEQSDLFDHLTQDLIGREQLVWKLKYLQGLSIVSVGRRLGLSRETIRKIDRLLRQKIRLKALALSAA